MKLHHTCEHCGNQTYYERAVGARKGPRGPRLEINLESQEERKKLYNKRYYEKKKMRLAETNSTEQSASASDSVADAVAVAVVVADVA